MRVEVTRDGKEQHNEELHVMSPYQVFHREVKRNTCRPFIGKSEAKNHLKGPGID
jgi:hypothetical protein